jgi:UDP-N-acetylmuramate dehydrogenase
MPDEFEVGYRSVRGPADEWFVGAHLRFTEAVDDGAARIRSLLAQRNASQPIGVPSCGSVFRNPLGDHAARLIESAGLKGKSIGGAMVSPKHANFIVNTGNASAADIEGLIEEIQRTIARVHGVMLETEVRIVGEPAVGAR